MGTRQPWVLILALGVLEAPGMRSPCPGALPTSALAKSHPCQAGCPCLTASSPPCFPRNLWQEVTRYLRLGDIDAATEQKRRLEEKQRVEERKRETLHTPWQPKYFIQEVTAACLWGLVPGEGQMGLSCQCSRLDG